ncbi:MAG: hypothetical protein R2799_02905 [Crocinitomicaceae bacterium]
MMKMLVVLLVMVSLPVIGQKGIRFEFHVDKKDEPEKIECYEVTREFILDMKAEKLLMIDRELNGDRLETKTYTLEFLKPTTGLITIIARNEKGERNEIKFGVNKKYVAFSFDNQDVIIEGDVYYESVLKLLE